MAENKEQQEAAPGPRYQYQGGPIRLDKEGHWFHEGVEVTHQLTAELFSRSVQKDPAGGYRLVVGLEWAPIEVEDTPFMVRRTAIENEKAVLSINDDTTEELDPSSLWVGKDNVLYCLVKKGEFPARFLRPAYYQLMQRLEETKGGYAVRLGDTLWPLREKQPA